MGAIEKTNWRIIRPERIEEKPTKATGDTVAKAPPKAVFACEKCKDTGYVRLKDVPVVDPRFGKAIKCECQEKKDKEKQQKELTLDSGILNMQRFRSASFDTFDVTRPGTAEAYGRAFQFAQEPEGWLVLLGPYGCGKTHLAAAIAKQCIATSFTVLIQTVPDLLDYLRRTFSPGSHESYEDRFNAMKRAEVLILDDYGAENSTDWTTEKIFQLLNHRYNMGTPTVITSNNIDLKGIDPRIYSRLHDEELVTQVIMDRAADYRMKWNRT